MGTRKKSCFVALTAILFAPQLAVVQGQVVDQSNYVSQCCFAPTSGFAGQTFRPSQGTSAGAGFLIDAHVPASGTLMVELWSDVASNVGAVLLASASSPFTIGQGFTMIDVFWPSVQVTPGAQYFLAVIAPGPQSLFTFTTISANNAYAGGGAWYSGDVAATTSYGDYTSGGFDLPFEEFSEGPIVTTPEPATLFLVASGLAGVFGIARRRGRPRRSRVDPSEPRGC